MTPRTTPPRPSVVPGVLWAVAVVLGAAAAVVVYDVVRILQLRRDAPDGPPLVHDTVVGGGNGPVRLVLLGDSAAAGYGLSDADAAYPRQVATALAARSGRPVALTSLAEDGARTADLHTVQLPRVGDHADVVVAAAGVNDALSRRRPADVERDTVALFAAIRERVPEAEIVLVGCPDLSSAPGFPWPLRHLVGRWCRRTCDAQERAYRQQQARGDPAVRFVRYTGAPTPQMYGRDGFHPGPAGQAAAAAATADAIRGP